MKIPHQKDEDKTTVTATDLNPSKVSSEWIGPPHVVPPLKSESLFMLPFSYVTTPLGTRVLGTFVGPLQG